MEHAKHIVRAFLLIFFILVILEIFRQSMRPESYGDLGPFRSIAIGEKKSLPVIYQNIETCISCHDSQAQTVLKSKHATINCQMCHAPLDQHAAEGEKVEDMFIDLSPDLCLRCHEQLTARPVTIKQINFSGHMEEIGLEEERTQGLCSGCHLPHEPDL